MNLKQFEKVYTLYLKGYSYSEIEKSTGIPKSTVQRWIQDFWNGDIGIFKETLPYVEELLSVGKFMREGGVELPEMKSGALIASIVKSLGIGIDELIGIGNALKDINNPEIVREVSWTVTNLIGKGIKPSELQQKIESMQKEKEQKEEELTQISVSIEHQKKAELEAKDKVLKVNEQLSANKKNLDEVKRELESVKKEKEDATSIIENAKKIDRFIQKNDIDLDQLNQFYSKARKHNFDIKRISSLSDLENFGLNFETDTHEISDIVKSLDSLYKKGWDHRVLKQLDLVTENTNVMPADAVDDLLRYYKETESLEDSLDALREEEKELKDSISSMTKEYNRIKEEYASTNTEKEEARKHKESLEGEISTLMQTKTIVENGIKEVNEISTKIMKKRIELISINNQIDTEGEELNRIRTEEEKEKDKIKNAQDFYDLIRFGTPDTVKSLKYWTDKALERENGNMNQSSVIERYARVRENAIRILLEVAGDGIGGIRYFDTDKLRFIDGKEYDDLVSYRNRRNEAFYKETEIGHELNQIKDDVSKFISDIVEERLKPNPGIEKLIVGVTERVISDQLKKEFEDAETYKSVIEQRYCSSDFSVITVKGWDKDSKLPVAGVVYPADFASALKTGKYVKITNLSGETSFIDFCVAMRQMYLYKYNFSFFKQVQEAISSGKITAVRPPITIVSPNKPNEKQNLQSPQVHLLRGGIMPKKSDQKEEEKKDGA